VFHDKQLPSRREAVSWHKEAAHGENGYVGDGMKNGFFISAAGLAAVVSLSAFGAGELDRGRSLYGHKCKICHGADGKGSGPAGEFLSPRPANFTLPAFWTGDVDKKISDTIVKGHGQMPSFNMKQSEIKDIIDYLSSAFKPGPK